MKVSVRRTTTAGITPDAVLAAHSHDFQRYTRFVNFQGHRIETPYLVVGTGGRGLSPHVTPATGQLQDDHRYEKSLRGYGYFRVSVTLAQIDLEFFEVDGNTGKKGIFDQVNIAF